MNKINTKEIKRKVPAVRSLLLLIKILEKQGWYQFEQFSQWNTIRGGDLDMFMECFEEDLTSSKSGNEATRDHEKRYSSLKYPQMDSLDTTTEHNLSPMNPLGRSNISIEAAATNLKDQKAPTTNVSSV